MTFRRSGKGAALVLAISALVLAISAGCSAVESQPVADAPEGVKVSKLSGMRPAETPPDPKTAAPSLLEVEASLRRIVVRYIKYTAFSKSDPQPLLTETQIGQFALILARELPKLTDTQRIRFEFTDRYFGRGYAVQMDVYREGTYLTYWFNALATNFSTPTIGGEALLFMGRLEQGPGQVAVNLGTYAYLKDPLLGQEREAAAIVSAKQQLLNDARKEGVFEAQELPRVEALAAKPRPSVEEWKGFVERRRTLKKALDQNLIDRAGYQVQVDRLYAEVDKP